MTVPANLLSWLCSQQSNNNTMSKQATIQFNGRSVEVSQQFLIEALKTMTASLNMWQNTERTGLAALINTTHDSVKLTDATRRYIEILGTIKEQRESISLVDGLVNPVFQLTPVPPKEQN